MTTRPRQGRVDAAVRCYYADDPTGRPDCDLTAVLRYGPIPLCRSCQSRRSTVGKGQRPIPLTSPDLDVLGWITTADRQATAAERTLTAAVARARQAGHPWSAIGAQLGVSRQAAQQRFTRSQPTPTRASSHESTKAATRASSHESTTPATRAH